jgi:hypothetical protein
MISAPQEFRLMDDADKRHNRIRNLLIVGTIVSVFLFLGIFMVFAASVKDLN